MFWNIGYISASLYTYKGGEGVYVELRRVGGKVIIVLVLTRLKDAKRRLKKNENVELRNWQFSNLIWDFLVN